MPSSIEETVTVDSGDPELRPGAFGHRVGDPESPDERFLLDASGPYEIVTITDPDCHGKIVLALRRR